MDDRGYWHNPESDKRIAAAFNERTTTLERPVIEIGVGEMVRIVKNDGIFVAATFSSAEKNRVTLSPTEGTRTYLDLAEHVTLERANGESVAAQVWDNRNNKIILRTLPVR